MPLPGFYERQRQLGRKKALRALRQGATFQMAAGAAGVCSKTLQRWRDEDPEFDRLCELARLAKTKEIHNEVMERAFDREDKYSGPLLAMVLKQRDPTFSEKRMIEGTVEHHHTLELPREDLDRLLRQAAEGIVDGDYRTIPERPALSEG